MTKRLLRLHSNLTYRCRAWWRRLRGQCRACRAPLTWKTARLSDPYVWINTNYCRNCNKQTIHATNYGGMVTP